MIKLIILIFLIAIPGNFLVLSPSKELILYEEAIKTEKISSLLAIPLYEDFLKTDAPKKYEQVVAGRLFDLYYDYHKIEDMIILGETKLLDKSRKKRLENYYSKISSALGAEPDKIKDVFRLAVLKDSSANEKLISIIESSKNNNLLNYIYIVKLKIGDYEIIEKILKKFPDVNPKLRVIYAVKINSNYTKQIIDSYYSTISSNDDKKEVYYLYGLLLVKNLKLKEAIRYFKMADSFDSNKNENKVSKSNMEISKVLFIKGYKSEACSIIENKIFQSHNESEEFLRIYCDEESKDALKKINVSLHKASTRENNLVIRRYIKDKK